MFIYMTRMTTLQISTPSQIEGEKMNQVTHSSSKQKPEKFPNPTQLTDSPFQEKLYFLYGTLMDPSTLASVLKQPGRPELHPATMTGYSIKLWGEYADLVE